MSLSFNILLCLFFGFWTSCVSTPFEIPIMLLSLQLVSKVNNLFRFRFVEIVKGEEGEKEAEKNKRCRRRKNET